MADSAPLTLDALNLDVLGVTASFLVPREALALSNLTPALRREAVRAVLRPALARLVRFGATPAAELPDAAAAVGMTTEEWVRRIARARRGAFCLSSSEMGGSWWDTPRYWRRNVAVDVQSSPFGVATLLQSVWWFEISGRISVPPVAGTYAVALRCRFSATGRDTAGVWTRSLTVVELPEAPRPQGQLAQVTAESPPEGDTVQTTAAATGGGGFRWVYLGLLYVPPPPFNPACLDFRVSDTGGTLKSNLLVDHLRLFPLGELASTLGVSLEEFQRRKVVATPAPVAAPHPTAEDWVGVAREHGDNGCQVV